MNDLLENLRTEFQDEEYRYGYAESFLNTKLAAQIKTLREQRGKTQVEIAMKMGIKQPGYRRFEDVNHSVWKTDSLWSIARALGVRLDISFEAFGTLPDEKRRLSKEFLQRPGFEDDPAFKEQTTERQEPQAAANVNLARAGAAEGNSMEAANGTTSGYYEQRGNSEAFASACPVPLAIAEPSGAIRRKTLRRLTNHGRSSKNVILFPKRDIRKRKSFRNPQEKHNGIGTQKAS
jgi:transcriptional regulator with XRE-family HTH domain